MTQQIAVLGMGVMGAGIAKNLLKNGYAVRVYNRTASKAQPVVDAGASFAATPREAAQGADVVISVIGDDAASRAVWTGDDGALAGAKAGAILIECSTLTPAWVRELGVLAEAQGCSFLDAPMTGSKPAAEAGELGLLVGGNEEVLEQVRPVLNAFANRIIYLGPVGSGETMKVINNLLGAVQVASLAEALRLAERTGLRMDEVVNMLSNAAPASPIVKTKIERVAARDYDEVHFALRWMLKDASYGLQVAESLGQSMPVLRAAREVYARAVERGFGDKDFAAVGEGVPEE
jgi:3-hydroxyisobutyrate dehydrogenase